MAINATDQIRMVAQRIAFLPSTQATGVRIIKSAIFFHIIGAALKCAPIMEWEFILASGRSSF